MDRIIHTFTPTPEKMMAVANMLMTRELYLVDNMRDWNTVYAIAASYVNRPQQNMIFEMGDFDGLVGFLNVLPGYKATLLFKLWNPDIWKLSLTKEVRKFIADGMKNLGLVRLDTHTADPRIVRMAKMAGFKVEGCRRLNFPWNGVLYDEIILAIIKEPKEKENGM